MTIPQGFRVARADSVEYETLEEATIPAGATQVDVAAAAVEPGEAGNAPANTILYPRYSLPTLARVSNPVPATGGADEESLEDQKRRFALYIAQVHRATRVALEAAVLTAIGPNGERAREALVLDTVLRPCLPPGVVEVYVDDGYGTASAELLQAAREAIEGCVRRGCTPGSTAPRAGPWTCGSSWTAPGGPAQRRRGGPALPPRPPGRGEGEPGKPHHRPHRLPPGGAGGGPHKPRPGRAHAVLRAGGAGGGGSGGVNG
ncbi:MAG: baseplate J/gp47 family protein [Thermus antranikianii]|nr:MAG: baseplate J/gp47 family protein [Thermus antranikianii]